jgi:parvulin-like peptidyl-prolyl isomerase
MLKEGVLRKLLVVSLALWAVLLSGCHKKPVAVVNGEEIPEKVFNWYMADRLAALKEQGTEMDEKDLKTVVLDELIAERLMVQGAKESGISVSDEEVGKEVEFIRKRVGEERFLKDLKDNKLTMKDFRKAVRDKLAMNQFAMTLLPETAVDEKEIEDFYTKNPDIFKRPFQVLVRLVETHTKEQAEGILGRMGQEGGFDEVADRLKGEGKVVVSNYVWASPDLFGPEISNSLKGLGMDSYGGPYRGEDSYYIIKKKKSRDEKVLSLDEAKEGIKSLLLAQKRQIAVADWVDENRKKAKIVTN